MRLEGTKCPLIVGAAAMAAIVGGQFLFGGPAMFDLFGLLSRDSTASSRLHLPQGVGNASADEKWQSYQDGSRTPIGPGSGVSARTRARGVPRGMTGRRLVT
jgi:hypothetical protein